MRVTAKDVLNDRENRAYLQQRLINKFKKPLICIRVNYPGIYKDNKISREIVNEVGKEVLNKFEDNIICKLYKFSFDGPFFLIIVDEPVYYIKRLCVDIENKHMLGRCVDIDVYGVNGVSISRKELGYNSRKCFLCNNYAHICVRMEKHSSNKVINYIETKYEKYMEYKRNENKKRSF